MIHVKKKKKLKKFKKKSMSKGTEARYIVMW